MTTPHTTENPRPCFEPGDRVFSHYSMDWGTINRIDHTQPPGRHGVTGSPLPGTTWYVVDMDKGQQELYDDASGTWDLARIVPPHVASRYGYGTDPQQLHPCPSCGEPGMAHPANDCARCYLAKRKSPADERVPDGTYGGIRRVGGGWAS